MITVLAALWACDDTDEENIDDKTDTSDTADTADIADTSDIADTADTADTSDTVDTADTSDAADTSGKSPVSLIAEDNAHYCVAPSDISASTLQETLADKAELWVTPGAYPLVAGSFNLPVEVTLLNGTVLSNAQNGVLTVSDKINYVDINSNSFTGFSYQLSQTLSDGKGALYTFGASFAAFQEGTAPPETFLLDGTQMTYTYFPPSSSYMRFWYCKGEGACNGANTIPGFGPCQPLDWDEQLTTVSFNGGEVALQLFIGPYWWGTEPAAFPAAWGNIDGVAFDQRDSFNLVYQPWMHHYLQDYAVLFDAPIGDACGLKIVGLERDTPSPTTATVHTIDCALLELEDRTIRQ